MDNEFKMRLITSEDAAAVLEVYRPYVANTIISFEYDVPGLEEFAKRVHTISEEYPWLVCEYNNTIVGYAYGSKHRYRTAYQWSVESTVYMSAGFHRLGIAKALYKTLFEILKLQGFVNVYAGIGLPNENSEEFHQALGFYEIGIFRKIGFKFSGWHDTRWFQLHLAEHADNPAPPKLMSDILNSEKLKNIIKEANVRLKNIQKKDTGKQ